jgi:hypothetical protein
VKLVAGQGHSISTSPLDVKNIREKELGSITEKQWVQLVILTRILYFWRNKNRKSLDKALKFRYKSSKYINE